MPRRVQEPAPGFYWCFFLHFETNNSRGVEKNFYFFPQRPSSRRGNASRLSPGGALWAALASCVAESFKELAGRFKAPKGRADFFLFFSSKTPSFSFIFLVLKCFLLKQQTLGALEAKCEDAKVRSDVDTVIAGYLRAAVSVLEASKSRRFERRPTIVCVFSRGSRGRFQSDSGRSGVA